MKKVYFLLVFAMASFQFANAQYASYDWSVRAGTQSTAKKSLVDGSGNIYVWVTAVAPITIGSETYTNTAYDNYLVKYNNTGTITWSKEIRIRMFNMCLTKDSNSVLISGLLNSAYTNYDLGNGISTGSAYQSAGIIFKVDGSTGNSLWVKTFDATLPALSSATRINSICETNAGIFCVQGLKMRRLDFDGNEIWNKSLTQNGTAYTLGNASNSNWADDAGNTFFVGTSDNSNTTLVTLNAVNYTTTANLFQIHFSLDSSGNTNWFKTDMNFAPKSVNVTKDGYIIMTGGLVYNNNSGFSNHPFIPKYCNKDYNVFKAELKTAKPIWSAYSFINNISNIDGNGNVYVLAIRQSAAVDFTVGTTTKTHIAKAGTNYLYMLRINNTGVPDSIVEVASLASNVTMPFYGFHVTNNGKFVMLYNRGNVALNFSNGNANLNTTTTQYQGLLQFTPASLPQRHTTVWTGTTNSSWFTASNWTNGIPTDSSNVHLLNGAINYPNTNADFYNTATASYAKCGFLKIGSAIDIFLSPFFIVNGLIENEGKLTYRYNFSGSAGNYNIWSTNNTNNAQIIGNGTITLNSIDGMYYNLVRTGNNKVVINLFNATDNIYFTDCKAATALNILKGNLDFSQTTTQFFYVDSNLTFVSPARFLGGSITAKAPPNTAITFPLGNSSNVQPATITIKNTTQTNYITASFSSTVSGTTPNATTCIVNGQGISGTLNGGMWTINAALPLTAGSTYDASFTLRGSTNTSTVDKYAVIKRDNSTTAWQGAGAYQAASVVSGAITSSSTNIGSFSDFAIGISNTTLPISSIKLSVSKQENKSKLNWNIIATNATTIEVQKSNDAKEFKTIHTQAYVAIGLYVDDITAGKNYYRIKVIDKQGNIAYSNVVLIEEKLSKEIQVYPTVFTQYFIIQNNNPKNLQLILMDISGKLVLQRVLATGTNIIYSDKLQSQTYLYQILDNNKTIELGKVIKQ